MIIGRLKNRVSQANKTTGSHLAACSVGWYVLLLIREEVLLTGLCKRKILFQLEIYDYLR